MAKVTCTKEKLVVETKKGIYTLPSGDNYAKGRCAAEAKCTEMEAILAPFTEKAEFDAVDKAILACEHQNDYEAKFVGLKISKDNSSRVFSNGVKFDYKLHGDLYEETQVTMPRDCPGAYMDPLNEDKIVIASEYNCWDIKTKYICFEPKKAAKSEAVTTVNVNSNFLILGGSIFLVAVACLVCYLIKEIKNLKSEKLRQAAGVL